MSAFDHTPGPYQLAGRLASASVIETVPADGRKARAIANVRGAGLSEKEIRANAALLSASARMHAVLWAIRGAPGVAELLAQSTMPDAPDTNLWKALNVALIEASTGIPVETQESTP